MRCKQPRKHNRVIALMGAAILVTAFGAFFFWPKPEKKPAPAPRLEPAACVLQPEATAALFGAGSAQPKDNWHPPHKVKVWTTRHKDRIFRVIQLPRCEHLETLVTYDPSGETLARAKERCGGIAACTGSFHHSKTMALADFLQRNGCVVSGAKTGRSLVLVQNDGRVDISRDYDSVRRKPGVTALALGQRLVPLQSDGFSTAFMNRVTDRMAIGVNDHFIFIIQGKTDIWRLAHFISNKLPVDSAVNSDGGHVVRGKAPVHIVFRWKKPASNTASNATRPVSTARN